MSTSSTIDPTPAFGNSPAPTSSCNVPFAGYSIFPPLNNNVVGIGPLSIDGVADIVDDCCTENIPATYQNGCSVYCQADSVDDLNSIYQCLLVAAKANDLQYYLSCPDCNNGNGLSAMSNGTGTANATTSGAATTTGSHTSTIILPTSQSTNGNTTSTTGDKTTSQTSGTQTSTTTPTHSNVAAGLRAGKEQTVSVLGVAIGSLLFASFFGGALAA